VPVAKVPVAKDTAADVSEISSKDFVNTNRPTVNIVRIVYEWYE